MNYPWNLHHWNPLCIAMPDSSLILNFHLLLKKLGHVTCWLQTVTDAISCCSPYLSNLTASAPHCPCWISVFITFSIKFHGSKYAFGTWKLEGMSYEEHIKGLYGLWHIRSKMTTKAMTIERSTFGMMVRLKTSSPSVTVSDTAPAFFLVILATSSPLPFRILQLLLQKLPCTLKVGAWESWSDEAVHPDMCTSASSLLFASEHFLMEKRCCRLEELLSPASSDAL